MNEKKVLYVISEFFAPNQNVGAIKFTKIVKYLLLTNKYEIYVFTRKNNPRKDEILEADLKKIIELGGTVYTIDAGKDYYKKSKIKRLVRKYKRIIIKPKAEKEYVKRNKKEMSLFVRRGEKLMNSLCIPTPDFLITTYDDFGAHKLGEKIKDKYGNQVFWITDFRDQVGIFFQDVKTREWADDYSKMITEKSDYITASASVASNMVLSEKGQFKDIHIGYDSEDIEIIKKYESTLSFAYAGSYYGDRTIRPLLNVICKLADEGKIDKGAISFNYCGTYGYDIKKELEEYELSNAYVDWGTVSHLQSMIIQNRADILITSVWNYPEYQGVIGGKTFEYIGLNKPIIAIVKGNLANSDMKKLIEGGQCGVCYEEANHETDIILLEKKIYQYYMEKRKNGHITHINDENFVSKYNLKNIAGQYDEIMQESLCEIVKK